MTTQLLLFKPESKWRPPNISQLPDLSGVKRISIDCETYDPDLKNTGPGVRRDGRMVGYSVGIDHGPRFYLPFGHEGGDNLPKDKCILWAKDHLASFKGEITGANLIYDLDYFAEEGVEFDPTVRFFDTQIAEPLLDENRFAYGLDVLAKDYLQEGKDEAMLREVAKLYKVDPKAGLWKLPARYVGPYAEADTDLPLRILEKQIPELESQGLWDLFLMEAKLLPVLLRMRRRGVRVDLNQAEILLGKMEKEIAEHVKIAQTYSANKIEITNVNTLIPTIQALGYTLPRTEKTDKASLTKDWMKDHASEEPFIEHVQKARELSTIVNTFLKGTILTHNVKGRIHCEFNQLKRTKEDGGLTGTAARFSSSNPNLQNIPVRTKMGEEIRRCFIGEPGESYERLDWSQIEYRFLVHYAMGRGAEEARKAYVDDPKTDFHVMCMKLAKVEDPYDGKTRKKYKNVNFGIVYGAGIDRTAETMGCPYAEAEAMITEYDRLLPFVKRTYNIAQNRARDKGFIRTILNRRFRYANYEGGFNKKGKKEKTLPLDSKDRRSSYPYKALNNLLQGSAADLMKLSMVLIAESGVEDILGPSLLTVHDELGLSKPKTKAGEEAVQEVKRIMETAIKLKVPVIAERESGPNWGDCE